MGVYSPDEIKNIFETICQRIEDGESLRSVLRSKDMPSRPTFFKWIKGNNEMINQYACACERRADCLLDDIIDISDNVEQDMLTMPDGREVVNNAVISRDKLRVDTRKWAMSKMNPKKYGDKVDIDHTTKGESLNDISKESTEDLIKRANAVKALNDKA